MPGFLLDTNHVFAWELSNPSLLAKMKRRPPQDIVWVSTITIGEIECGLRITTTTDQARRDACKAFIAREVLEFVHPVEEQTGHAYAEIMERIWKAYPPPNPKRKTDAHLVDLGVDVNDIWIASIALEHNLTLLTTDAMTVIRECCPDIRVEDWTT